MDRKKVIGALAALLIFISVLYLSSSGQSNLDRRVVTRVIDGDTIVVEGGQRIRLLGIDTQEEGKPCYEKAKHRLEDLILKKKVGIQGREKGQYGRRLAYIFLNRTLINEQLVREGLAVAYFYEEGTKYKDRIQEAEQEAIQNKRGCEWS